MEFDKETAIVLHERGLIQKEVTASFGEEKTISPPPGIQARPDILRLSPDKSFDSPPLTGTTCNSSMVDRKARANAIC